ncbi:OmpA family protein [Flavobacterium sp. NRK F10]|uniref:OmpA family protein n=1 Tax=Flavobacterium sp. NRK F10 TaxID=2954931 RepID=UPI002091C08D|nr:OmpA family protein [Flavobacterium sp. NRK F10]MCO6175401.1 OmpA family protein [Flavobacterium sp. NRK F10]
MKKRITIALLVGLSIGCFGQNNKIKKADDRYDDLAYMDAVTVYEKVVDKGYGTAEIYEKLGNSYYFNADYVAANKWYNELFKSGTSASIDPESYYRYSQSLKSVGDTEKANAYLEQFSKLKPNDPRSLAYVKDKNYLTDIAKVSDRYQLEDAGINSSYSDYGPAFYKDGIVFTSSRGSGDVHTWTNQPYSDLYYSTIGEGGKLEKAEQFDKKINTKFNESTAVFTKDGKTMYFTRNNFLDGKKGKNGNETILLKIYKARLNGKGKWEDVEELPFNSNNYNCAHPALSPDEKTLYFSSDMPGGYGESDLYAVTISGENNYGSPKNLGLGINTPGRETFPFVTKKNELFFASDGHLGLGGLDIFGVQLKSGGLDSKVYNIGRPINTEFDDFAYIIDTDNKLGYYSSNKSGGEGYDDIYRFKEKTSLPLDCKQLLEGKVTDAQTHQPLRNAHVTLFDAKMQEISSTSTDANGNYSIDQLACDSKFFIRVSADQYDTNEVAVTTSSNSGTQSGDIALTKRFNEIKEEVDLAKVYDIENIYFDLDKWNITKKAEEKLSVLLAVMEEYPSIKVDVRSHTDCRQTYDYNMRLSNKRAKATIDWLVNHGIAANRLTGKGYGESQLVNDCGCEPANDSPCTEAQHQQNRRSEFIVVKK